MAVKSPYGWDVPPCWAAIQSAGHGVSPYAGGITALTAYHLRPSHPAGDRPPLIFWYSPLTIPMLRELALFPAWLLGPLYGCALSAGFLLSMSAGYRMASEKERRWLIFVLPFAAFFPGLLCDQAILSGNVAFILYGLILAAAVSGWKRNRWLWFYAAVIVASVCKAPMLSLLAFPILVGRRQWAPACVAGAAGCLLFPAQAMLWPAQFKEFLTAVRLVFEWAHDFGFSPSGLLGRSLWAMKKPYSTATAIAYILWAVALGSLLLAVRHRVRRKPHLCEAWIPVAFVGTILLNPRIIFYDTAPLTVPLLLIVWRVLLLGQKLIVQRRAQRESTAVYQVPVPAQFQTPREDRANLAPILAGVGCFAACNLIDILWGDRVPIELTVLLLIFALGVWSLLSFAGTLSAENA